MKHQPQKPQTLKFGNLTVKVGTASGKPRFSITGKSAINYFSGTIDSNIPDELVKVAIAMREALEAGK